jgi:cytochrome c
MKLVSIFAATALIASVPTFAADELGLAKQSGCLACHSVDKKIVGPAYKDVAKKYAGEKGAEAKLMAKVKKGGSGVWGAVPMPPNPQVSEANLKKIIGWILSLK